MRISDCFLFSCFSILGVCAASPGAAGMPEPGKDAATATPAPSVSWATVEWKFTGAMPESVGNFVTIKNAKAAFSVVAEAEHPVGKGVLQAAILSPSDRKNDSDIQLWCTAKKDLAGGEKLRISFWVRGTEETKAKIVMILSAAPYSAVSKPNEFVFPVTTEWKEVVFETTATAVSGKQYRAPCFFFGISAGTIQLANIKFESKDAVSAFLTSSVPRTTVDADLWKKRVIAAGGVSPSPMRSFSNERTCISSEAPRSWASKTRLRGMTHLAPGSLDPKSLVISAGERTFSVGTDVLLDPVWGGLGLGTNSVLSPKDEVVLSYDLSSRRLDALVRSGDGKEYIRTGTPHPLTPSLPEVQEGDTVLAYVFVDYLSDGTVFDVLPLLESAAKAVTATTGPQRVAKTVAKLNSGKPVTIICWGDSVTEGGDVEMNQRYGDQLAARLKGKYPTVTVTTMAVGGSSSRQWLLDLPPAEQHRRKEETRFQRVLDARPDLVVVEFVNDQWLNKEQTLAHYREKIIAPLRAIGAEVLLLTPQRNWDRKGSWRDPDAREYVAALREMGRSDDGVGIADMAGRWEHLWREGIPFPCYLANGFNHPDVRGHSLFTEEILKALGL